MRDKEDNDRVEFLREQLFSFEHFEKFSKGDRIQFIVKWFQTNHVPADIWSQYKNIRPLDINPENGYLEFPQNDVFDAESRIGDVFWNISDRSVIEEAVKIIEINGVYEWSTKYLEEENSFLGSDEDFFSTNINPEDGLHSEYTPSFQDHKAYEENELEIKSDIAIQKLEALEKLITPLASNIEILGHNNPPEDFGSEGPCTRQEWADLKNEIISIKNTIAGQNNSEESIVKSVKKFEIYSKKIISWIGKRIEKGLDSVITTAGGSLGVSMIVDIQEIKTSMDSALISVSDWFSALQFPF